MPRITRLVPVLAAASLAAAVLPTATSAPVSAATTTTVTTTYTNPLAPQIAGGGTVSGCADPSVSRGRGAYAGTWYMYCTSDALNDAATTSRPVVITRLPTMRSTDLVHWTYVGSALPGKPSWAAPTAKLWAPDVVYSSTTQRYYMTFAVTDTATSVSGEPGCSVDPSIGVAVASTPTGPWTIADSPLVPPVRSGPGCSFTSNIDPDVLGASIAGHGVLYSGGFRGGIYARPVSVSASRLTVSGAATQLTIGRRYEGANVVAHDGFYYLFASSGSCCVGPLSGYGVFVGRSTSPYGPFVDREGNSLLAGRTGGTPVLQTNGNQWIGPGHTSAFTDFGGQSWMVYHAVSRADPFYANQPGYTKRSPMLDPMDWVDGWPTVRDGRGASSKIAIPAPAAQRGQVSAYRPSPVPPDLVGDPIAAATDAFNGSTVKSRWTWVREPDPASYQVVDGHFAMDTQNASLPGGTSPASVLTERAPTGDFVVQTAVRLDLPTEGAGFDYVQAGLVIRGSDDSFVKLTSGSVGETRTTEFVDEVPPGPTGYPVKGTTAVGPPGDVTWLRLVRRAALGHVLFRAYSSQDGQHWVRGGTWAQDQLGSDVRIGLVAMGGAGFHAQFSYVHTWSLRP